MKPEVFVMMILFIYMPFHFLEEAIGDFPKWMYKHWTPMHISYGQWMANNIFIFYPLLVISYLVYHFNLGTLSFLGGALLWWGIINGGEHIFYTIKDRKVAPGLLTGCIYIIDAILGMKAFYDSGMWSMINLALSIVVGGILFGLPCYLAKKVGTVFAAKFGTLPKAEA